MKSENAASLARRFFRVTGPIAAVLALAVIAFTSWRFWASEREFESTSTVPPDVASPQPAPDPIASAPSTNTTKKENLPPAVARYLAATIYPPGTGRLTAAQDDLIHPNQRYEDFRRVLDTYNEDESQVVSVRLTADHFFYTGDETIELRLQVRRGTKPIRPKSVNARALREGRGGSEGNPIPIRFHRTGDGLEARLDSARFADHHGPVLVQAQIEYEAGAYYEETLRFFYTPANKIPARFTGEFRDSLQGGSLRVDIGIDVDLSGFYRIDANLYDRFGNPVSFAAFKGNLEAGKRFVPIQFFGRVLRDVNANGPYRVEQIRGYRFLDGEYPDRERIPDFAGRYQTARYAANQFSDDEYSSEQKQRMVQLLLEDVAHGISIDQPPLANVNTNSSPTESVANNPTLD